MLSDILLLLVLILLNGVFALSEIAIVSSRRARLQQMADGGSGGARHALVLASEPTRFLSSVQIGITSIGILSGAIGEAAIADRLRVWLEQVPAVAEYAQPLALGLMVVALTYTSLILGELVPKRLALTHPEAVAAIISRPMEIVATVGRPLVKVLSLTTDGLLRLVGVRQEKRAGVTADEIRLMLQQGAEEGVFLHAEQQMVTNVLNLDERVVAGALTPRAEIVFLDLRDDEEVTRGRLRNDPHNVLPLCDGGLDHVVGFVRSKHLLERLLHDQPLDLRSIVEPPLFVPETMTLMKLLEQFKRTHLPVALVVDEFGGVAGLVSLTDVVSAIVGELQTDVDEEPMILRRDDGSWLMDGALDIDAMLRALEAPDLLTPADRQHFHTLGGLAMLALGRVPRTGDRFQRSGFTFEVVDMDGNRVDRVLVTPPRSDPAP